MKQEETVYSYEAMKRENDAIVVDTPEKYFRIGRRRRRTMAHGMRKLANQRKATRGRVRQYVAVGGGVYKFILHKRK